MEQFDFIVVGAGSAGSVVANRLTEAAGVTVLVLEAGGREIPPNVADPSLWPTLLHSSIDWGYQSVPQAGLEGRSTYEPRGKLPGGSSNLYLMMHVRGHPSDFDHWAYEGCPGWSFQDVLPYFKKIEDQEDDTSGLAGHGGPISVINAGRHNPNPTSAAFIEACIELGFPRCEDFNGPEMEGAGWHHLNIKDGKRHSAAEGYLAPVLGRPNLTLRTGAQATRLIFQGRRCIGVEYVTDGKSASASCENEVIVCAGAIESPKLLMLSGIGPASHLAEFKIPVVVECPGVGENFHNHVLTGLICESSRPMEPPHLNLSESALFCKSGPGWIGPDLQLGFVHVPFDIIVGQSHPNAFSILPGVVRPMSRGWVRLASADPLEKPLINPNYLAAEADLVRLVGAVELARKIFATRAFSGWVQRELMPGPEIGGGEQLREWVRHNADSYHHQAGSCKMGLDPMAVVDPELRVHGVDGLRVADASVMPTVPSGNCHTAILMIGERVADKIKATYRERFEGSPTSTTVSKSAASTTARFSHIALACKDPLTLERYYTKHFGFQRARVISLGQEQIVFIKSGSVYLELFQARESSPLPPAQKDGQWFPGVRHLAFQVDDLDAKIALMGADAQGDKVTLGPLDFSGFIPNWRTIWLRDPEGNIVEVSQGFVDQTNPPPG